MIENVKLLTDVKDITTFQVRGNRILLDLDTATTKTDGGVILPENSKLSEHMLAKGVVVSAGSQAGDLKPGDCVYFYRTNAEAGVRVGDKAYYMFPEYAIQAVVKPKDLVVSE